MCSTSSLVNQPVFSGLRMRARKGEGEGKEKTGWFTRLQYIIEKLETGLRSVNSIQEILSS